jgi:hypothetical protein
MTPWQFSNNLLEILYYVRPCTVKRVPKMEYLYMFWIHVDGIDGNSGTLLAELTNYYRYTSKLEGPLSYFFYLP